MFGRQQGKQGKGRSVAEYSVEGREVARDNWRLSGVLLCRKRSRKLLLSRKKKKKGRKKGRPSNMH